MRSFSDALEHPGRHLGRRPGVPAAAGAVLFPELAGRSTARLAPGLLRAPPRGWARPPCLSAYLFETAAPGVSAGVTSPGQVLAERGWEEPALLARAAAARQELVAARVGGAWWHGGDRSDLPAGDGQALVVLGEPGLGDSGPPPGKAVFDAMLDAALAANPGERVVVVVVAPASAGRRRGSSLAAARARGAAVIDRPVDPWVLIERAGRVYSAGGEIGFLALLAGVPVTAFAPSWHTGWGATEDAAGVPPRPFRRTVDEIFAGVCLVATRYRDPFRGSATSFEEVLAILADWRRLDEANRGIAVCVGMSFWKRRRVADFVRSSAGVPVFRRTVAGALAAAQRTPSAPPGAIAGWASRLPEGLAEAAARQGVPLIRVEDGFIRSVGLGSDFLPPASLVFDRSGMYFDPRQESDLERLLREAAFPPALVARAERLTALLVARGITKYNLAASGPGLDLPPQRRRILVPGQVEDDLSIRFGAGEVRSNLDLLARVRAANPDACILYKPHPDVLAGHRIGAVPEAEVRRFADIVVTDGAAAALLAVTDELHTMTSLAGFEALLRGRRVVVYGRPFYAGWGLTVDEPRFDRGRQLGLAQLVAGALILYPRYLDPLTRLPCGPEIIIERLDRPELWRPGPLVLARRLQGSLVRRLGEWRAMLGVGTARGLGERPRP
jgi:capsular polysaccharide export protein